MRERERNGHACSLACAVALAWLNTLAPGMPDHGILCPPPPLVQCQTMQHVVPAWPTGAPARGIHHGMDCPGVCRQAGSHRPGGGPGRAWPGWDGQGSEAGTCMHKRREGVSDWCLGWLPRPAWVPLWLPLTPLAHAARVQHHQMGPAEHSMQPPRAGSIHALQGVCTACNARNRTACNAWSLHCVQFVESALHAMREFCTACNSWSLYCMQCKESVMEPVLPLHAHAFPALEACAARCRPVDWLHRLNTGSRAGVPQYKVWRGPTCMVVLRALCHHGRSDRALTEPRGQAGS